MFSPIANTTFSYILSLNKFRNSLPKEHQPSWVRVTTITMVSKVINDIDIHKLRTRMSAVQPLKLRMKGSKSEGFEWKLKESKFYNQVTLGYKDAYSNKSIKIFPNGSIQVAGCSDLFDCNRVIKQIIFILKMLLNLDDKLLNNNFKVVMINTNFSINYNINLFKLAEHFSNEPMFQVSFDPDRYSAVKIKFKPASDMKQVTTSIFSTGRVIITGAETLKEIAYSYNIINQHILSRAKEIKVERVSNPDVFDVVFGYNINELVKELTKRGFCEWRNNPINHQINF